MLCRLVYVRAVAPYQKKDGTNSDGGYDLHFLQPKTTEENSVGTPVQQIWLTPKKISLEEIKNLSAKVPCDVILKTGMKFYNGKPQLDILGIEVVK